MNIAFQAVLVFVFLLPGFIFQNSYTGKLSKVTVDLQSFTSFSRGALIVLIAATILNSIWASLFHLTGIFLPCHFIFFNLPCHVGVDLHSYFYLLTGKSDNNAEFQKAIDSIANYAGPIFLYYLLLISSAAFGGLFLHKVVRQQEWDIKYPLLRFDNEWHYLLTGEVRKFPELKNEQVQSAGQVNSVSAEVDVLVAAVVETKDGTYLYLGFVYDFYFDGAGNLDKLFLVGVYRRKISEDRKAGQALTDVAEDNRYYEINGDYFVLPYSEVKNLTIKYISVTEPEKNSTE